LLIAQTQLILSGIGAWHPSKVMFSVARAGQNGYHHRTSMNHKVYRIGQLDSINKSGSTEFVIAEKSINPLGSWVRYGNVKNDFVMLKGSCPGPVKRVITLRKALRVHTSRAHLEKVQLKYIDTTSKFGHGKFNTPEEKAAFLGQLKIKASA